MKSFLFLFLLDILVLCNVFLQAQWEETYSHPGDNVINLTISGNNIFAVTYKTGVFLSTDNGTSWNAINNGLPSLSSVRTLAIKGNNIFAGTYSGVFLSTDNGTNWTSVSNGLMDWPWVTSLAVSGNNIYAGTYGSGVFLSTDDGSNWTAVNYGLTFYGTIFLNIFSLAVIGNNIIAGAESGAFISSDNGTTWSLVDNGLTFLTAFRFATSGNNIFAAATSGVFLSTDSGYHWSAVNSGLPQSSYVRSFAVSGTSLFAQTDTSGVFLSTDDGSNWTSVNTGLGTFFLGALAANDRYLFAGTQHWGFWRRPLSDLITSVNQNNYHDSPITFALDQNYPNPFNPSTTINYSLPSNEYVTLKVYNLLGEEVAILVNEEKPQGTYELKWNAPNLPSGIYFYKLQAGNFVETKKMILLK
jgi:photosystem II stability/assembly factor-like uncharacterized protein